MHTLDFIRKQVWRMLWHVFSSNFPRLWGVLIENTLPTRTHFFFSISFYMYINCIKVSLRVIVWMLLRWIVQWVLKISPFLKPSQQSRHIPSPSKFPLRALAVKLPSPPIPGHHYSAFHHYGLALSLTEFHSNGIILYALLMSGLSLA